MNCANHPEIPVAAYCQHCGKPLCKDCIRSVGGVTYCEPCLLARIGPGVGGPGTPVDPTMPGFTPSGVPIPGPSLPNPALAGLLGCIPGVGAMYNGQFVKALAHVLIFAVFVSLADHAGVFGIFIAAWVFYQIFDAAQTAKARRDGLPLPDPFGLNDLGYRLGLQTHPGQATYRGPGVPPNSTPGSGPAAPGSTGPWAGETPSPGGVSAGFVPPAGAPYSTPYGPYTSPGQSAGPAASQQPYTPEGGGTPPPAPPPYAGPGYAGPGYGFDPSSIPVTGRPRDLPTGAIILIALGVLLLFGTLGIFSGDWVGRGWPLVIIAVGIWLFVRRSRELPPPSGGGMPGGGQ